MFTNNSLLRRTTTVWADAAHPVTRRIYLVHGLMLALAKYLGDVVLVFAMSGAIWTPPEYVRGLPALIMDPPPGAHAPVIAVALVLWMLPFLALGVMLTARRAVDARLSPWLSILFLVPYAKNALILVLCAVPSRRYAPTPPVPAHTPTARAQQRPARLSERAARLLAGATGIAVVLLAVVAGVHTLRSYGAWLFILAPFAMGASTAFVYHRCRPGEAATATSLVLLTLFASGMLLVLVALEGVVCLVMAAPLAVPLAVLGAHIGRLAAAADRTAPFPGTTMLLALPLSAMLAPSGGATLHEVRSSIVIDAAPDAIWPHVIAFPEIPPPDAWMFRAGVAFPVHAHIDGSGVGAVRYCVFSTGAFVEPITRWEPGHRLSFDVVESPAPLRELSPYRDLAPPHLHGYLRARRGEFRLVDLGDGRTQLEGSTWYELEMAPEAYWRLFSDAIIHRIHHRVLHHIKEQAERRIMATPSTGRSRQ